MGSQLKYPVSFRLATLAIVADFTISANILSYLGVPYTDEGGSFLVKLHPGTYLAAFAMAARVCDGGHLPRNVGTLVWRERGLALFLVAISFCVVSAACFTGTGNLIALLDTFLPAGMLAVALCDMTPRQVDVLAGVLRALFLLNATIAIAEAACGSHLVPVVSAGPEKIADFRPTGLYDHPLTGAAATMVGLLAAPSTARAPWLRLAYQLWLFAALLAFGGRVALALAVLCMGGMLLAALARRAMARRMTSFDLLPLLLAVLVALPLACAGLAAGWGERLQTHFFWDPSAQARIAQFHLLGLMSPEQLMFGCRRIDLLALIEPLRLAYGVDVIENFWLLLFAALGVLGFAVFVTGMFGLVTWLWQRVDGEGRLMLISMLIAASASNSLGRKSALLVILVASLLARARRPGLTATNYARAQPVRGFVLGE